MELYIFENYKEVFPDLAGRELTDALIMEALREYAKCDSAEDVNSGQIDSSEDRNSGAGRRSDVALALWKIARTGKGKPYLVSKELPKNRETSEQGKETSEQDGEQHIIEGTGSNSNPPYISVSHSGELFACLIGNKPLGVDIQTERKVRTEKISERYFTEEETRYAAAKGNAGFFKLWTRKESYSKYTGKGLEEVMGGASVFKREDVEFVDFIIGDGMYCSCCIEKCRKDACEAGGAGNQSKNTDVNIRWMMDSL